MAYTTQHLPDLGIILTRHTGEINDTATIMAATRDCIALSRQVRCHRFLTDYSQAILNLSVVDAFYLANEAQNVDLTQGDRIAVVRSRADKKDLHEFLDTALQNRFSWRMRHTYRYFDSYEEALAWLTG